MNISEITQSKYLSFLNQYNPDSLTEINSQVRWPEGFKLRHDAKIRVSRPLYYFSAFVLGRVYYPLIRIFLETKPGYSCASNSVDCLGTLLGALTLNFFMYIALLFFNFGIVQIFSPTLWKQDHVSENRLRKISLYSTLLLAVSPAFLSYLRLNHSAILGLFVAYFFAFASVLIYSKKEYFQKNNSFRFFSLACGLIILAKCHYSFYFILAFVIYYVLSLRKLLEFIALSQVPTFLWAVICKINQIEFKNYEWEWGQGRWVFTDFPFYPFHQQVKVVYNGIFEYGKLFFEYYAYVGVLFYILFLFNKKVDLKLRLATLLVVVLEEGFLFSILRNYHFYQASLGFLIYPILCYYLITYRYTEKWSKQLIGCLLVINLLLSFYIKAPYL